MKRALGYFLLSVVSGFTAVGIYTLVFPEQHAEKAIISQTQPVVRYASYSGAEGSNFVLAAEQSVNAVVHVKTQSEIAPAYNPWAQFFGYDMQPRVETGSGSGVIISNDGYIVTNNHVIEGANSIAVSLNDGSEYSARLIGTDKSTDLAVLKIEAEEALPTIPFGSSDVVKVGEWVLAVGNPFDLTSTVTAGIVSAKARNINLLEYDPNNQVFPVESFIQTDAAVNPGNSGGALVNTRGELIGINTAIASRTGSYAGYSFAIPSGIVEKVARDLMEYGNVQRGYIGVVIREVDQSLATELGMKKASGIYVSDLSENGAASEAGIRQGDVILSVSGVAVNSVPQLQEQVSKYRPGDKVGVKIWRKGEEQTVNVVLRDNQGNSSVNASPRKNLGTAEARLGAALDLASAEELKALGLTGGVKVKELNNGKLLSSGVKKGFIISKADGRPVMSVDDLNAVISSASGGILLEGYYPNGTKAYYGLGL